MRLLLAIPMQLKDLDLVSSNYTPWKKKPTQTQTLHTHEFSIRILELGCLIVSNANLLKQK